MAGDPNMLKFLVCILLSSVYFAIIPFVVQLSLFIVQNSSKPEGGFAPWKRVKSRGTGAFADWPRAPEIEILTLVALDFEIRKLFKLTFFTWLGVRMRV